MNDTCAYTGGYTITPALTEEEREDLCVPYLSLTDSQDGTHTKVTPDDEGECDALRVEVDIKKLTKAVYGRISGHLEIWGRTHGDLYRLAIVDDRVRAYSPEIVWPTD